MGSQLSERHPSITEWLLDYWRDLWQDHTQAEHDDIKILAFGDPQIPGSWDDTPYWTKLDIFGNDYYLGHIFDTMQRRLDPDYVVVMGDLFSSQWIADDEFFSRTRRYMQRIFKRDSPDLNTIRLKSLNEDGSEYKVNWKQWGDNYNELRQKGAIRYDYNDTHYWSTPDEPYLFLNLTGNHDIGYSGDCTYQHRARYEQFFGKDNYWIEYDRNTTHPWRIVVLNDLLLDGPALQPEFIEENWNFLKRLNERNFNGSTVLLTHVPFYKEEGLCFDGPEFRYYPEKLESESYKAKLLKSQNHLSRETSNKALDLIFNNGKPGIILVGHDHEGCEVYYNKVEDSWDASRQDLGLGSVKEVTVRSMMGEFHGHTGIITGHFNKDSMLWEWYYNSCPFMVQHVWWVAKVSLILAIVLWSTNLVT